MTPWIIALGIATSATGDEPPPTHFANDVVPILTRYGCNAGGCHGKASGQNGFKLSLFGFDPAADHEAIVREGRGRRVFPADPERSLILTKPSGRVPHGGGRLLEPEDEAYQTLRAWIAQGMPIGRSDAPTLAGITVDPSQRTLGREAEQALKVMARYTDGSTRDVTRHAQFDSNEPGIAGVDARGAVRTGTSAGEAAIMARYQGQVAVFRLTIPIEPSGSTAFTFPANNFIDDHIVAKWRAMGLVPSGPCTDGEFLRRVRLDLNGKLPTPEEVRAFLDDPAPDKRTRLVDRCLDDPDYAAYFAMRWSSLLRNTAMSQPAAYAFHNWIQDTIAENRPYDELVRGIVAASGEWPDAPAVYWYANLGDEPLHQATADTAQLFLGLRLQCARCHHHPYERWSQDDYYGLAGFFSRVARKDRGGAPGISTSRTPTVGDVHPRTGAALEPKPLDGQVLKIPPEQDPRQALVDWMVRRDNPFFAKALCNRMWGLLMGRGLVEPIDDLRATNPPTNPELLQALADDFAAHGYDVKRLVRTICTSRVYGLSSTPNATNAHDRQNHARAYGKRLVAEVLLDAVDQVCGTKTSFDGTPPGARTVDLPHEGFGSYFLDVFDRPRRNSACECARSTGASLPQVLHLANSPEVEDKLAADDGRIARLAAPETTPEAAVEDLYLAAFARKPRAEELRRALDHPAHQEDRRRGLEDLAWVLLNSREFLFNH
jgi:hypothetical protein